MRPKLVPSSRRFTKDEHHAYGWAVAFRQTVILSNGSKRREHFRDIGTTKRTAIANALRRLDCLENLYGAPVGAVESGVSL